MKRILKYIWLWGLLSLCVSSCEEEAAVINPDVSHDKPIFVFPFAMTAAFLFRLPFQRRLDVPL